MKRKKTSTTPPTKDKDTPAKEENSFLVGLMKKHDISYDQALKMSIQMDAEKDIFNVSKMNLLHQLNDSENLGTHQLSEGVDMTGKELRVYSEKDQISPENVVEYTNINGETFDVEKIREEMSRSSLLSSMTGLPLSGDLDSCRVSDVTSQHPDVLRMKKELEKEKKEKAELKKTIADVVKEKEKVEETLVRVVTIQSHPPSPETKKTPSHETKKTKILNKIQKQYELTLLGNGKQKIGVKVFHKTEEVQDILKWGQKTHDIPLRGKKAISRKAIADRMRTVNKDFKVNTLGRPTTFVPKPTIKSLLLKVDLDELDEEFLKEGF